jgi:DNA repair exonuclease SbcCD nuclease subunit
MEILVVGDSHITGRNPIARKDDLVTVQFEKWKKIVELSNDYNVPIIQTGDIFNIAVVANSILTTFGEILNKLNNPMYLVWGNHDLQYHSFSMWDRTSLGVLLSNNNKVRHISQFDKDYDIKWAFLNWSEKLVKRRYLGEPPSYLLTHKAIVNNKLTGTHSWILKDKEFCIPVTELPSHYHIVICGHWHKRYNFKYKNTRILNPGPITRRTVEEWFIPSVTLLDLNTRIMKKIPVSDLDPEQVLSRTHIEQKVESLTENVMQFIDALKNKKISHKKSFIKTLYHNLDQHELPNQVETLLRNIIADLIEKGVINEI